MTKLFLALAVVLLATSPALAKKHQKPMTADPNNEASLAYAYVPERTYNYPTAVYAFGQYQGADPDPFIRQQLMRDPPSIQQ
jgi:hypothetical protein